MTAEHAIALPGTEHDVWRTLALRGAGFPAAEVLELAAPSSAAAVDRLHESERAARADAVAALRAAPPEDRAARKRAKRSLRRLEGAGEGADLGPEVEAQRAAAAHAFAEDTRRIAATLRRLAAEPRFVEAMTWQNFHGVSTGVAALLRADEDARDKKTRQHEQLIASYLQRYCVKNDTIGFFGPVGWGSIADAADGFAITPGAGLVTERRVYFEAWAIDALAAALLRDGEVRPWLRPRLLPYLRVDGDLLVAPGAPPIPLAPGQARLLAACDGSASARALAASLVADGSFASEAEALQMLELARGMGVVRWDFDVPMDLHPERELRRTIEQVEDEPMRLRCEAAVAELEVARDAVAAAADDAPRLGAAMAALDATFTRLTGEKPTRSAGKTYAARTLVYEDCRRDIDATFGSAVLERLAPSLSLLLTTARWLTHEIARRFGAALDGVYDELAATTGTPVVDLATAQLAFLRDPTLNGKDGEPAPIAEALAEMQLRWAEILAVPPGAEHVDRSSAELRPLVDAAFATDRAGWPTARYTSPDIMLAARDVEALRRGEYTIVLGELHLANTLGASLFVAQHPDPGELFRFRTDDLGCAVVVPVAPRDWVGQRVNLALVAPDDLRLESGPDPRPRGSRGLRIADCVLERVEGRLEVRTRDAVLRVPALEFLGCLFELQCVNSFDLFARGAERPRLTIDGVVVVRRSRDLDASALAFAAELDPLRRFAGARAFAHEASLPRFVFARVSSERKPFFVDFTSPVLVDILAKAVRGAGAGASVRLTEMLPAFDDLWLPDHDDRRYTCELRLVMLDRRT